MNLGEHVFTICYFPPKTCWLSSLRGSAQVQQYDVMSTTVNCICSSSSLCLFGGLQTNFKDAHCQLLCQSVSILCLSGQ